MTFEIFYDKKNLVRFRIISGNNKVVAQSEGYKTKQSALRTIKRMISRIQSGNFNARIEVK
jgi:uncharacterized protein YegP (UPF0339 family)